MRKPLWILACIALAVVASCKKAEPAAAGPAPTAAVVYIVVTPSPVPTSAEQAIAAALTALPRPTASSKVVEYPVPAAASANAVSPLSPTAEPFCTIEDFVVREPDSIGNIWFDGEVRNLSGSPAKVKLLVKAYSINEVLLDSKSFWPDRHPIPPGDRAHFRNYVKSSRRDDAIRKVLPEVIPE